MTPLLQDHMAEKTLKAPFSKDYGLHICKEGSLRDSNVVKTNLKDTGDVMMLRS